MVSKHFLARKLDLILSPKKVLSKDKFLGQETLFIRKKSGPKFC